MTPFEEEGYTKETKFRVLRDMFRLKKGDIVTLYKDGGTICPKFITEDGRKGTIWIPSITPHCVKDLLEVYEEHLTKYLITTLHDNIVKYAKNLEDLSFEINKMGIEVLSVGEIKDLNIEKITEYKITED